MTKHRLFPTAARPKDIRSRRIFDRLGLSVQPINALALSDQGLPGADAGFEGGFAVYDAPEPWGPWTRAYFTERWDVGPGESSSLPTKWMNADGTTVHLVFSGEDAFSVRRATVVLR